MSQQQTAANIQLAYKMLRMIFNK